MSLISRGELKELTPKHWCADGRDSWACVLCGAVFYDDTKLNDELLCEHCSETPKEA